MPKDHQASPDTTTQTRGQTKGVIPPPRAITEQPHAATPTKPESSKEQTRSQEKALPWFIQFSKPEWLIVYITAIYVYFTMKIWTTMSQQAEDAREANVSNTITAGDTLEAIKKQADIMEQQATEARAASAQQMQGVQASIAEATRVSKAMEDVAVSMAASVESVKESVLITREMGTVQKLVTELQTRAYISVAFERAFFQDAEHVFEVSAVLQNTGNTPAYDVIFRATAQIIDNPTPEGFAYPLPDETAGSSASLIAPGKTKLLQRSVSGRVPEKQVGAIKRGQPPHGLAMWGIVTYRDAFKQIRHTRFAFTVTWRGYVKGMDKDGAGNPLPEPQFSHDTAEHNDAD